MLTKYVGKADLISVEYNGKKYCFCKKTPIKEIPTEVYNFLQRSNSLHIEDVVPYFGPNPEPAPVAPKEEGPKEEVKEVKKVKKTKGE